MAVSYKIFVCIECKIL